jgi:hypothetical protein
MPTHLVNTDAMAAINTDALIPMATLPMLTLFLNTDAMMLMAAMNTYQCPNTDGRLAYRCPHTNAPIPMAALDTDALLPMAAL